MIIILIICVAFSNIAYAHIEILSNGTVECVKPSYCAPFNGSCAINLDDISIPSNVTNFWASQARYNAMWHFDFPQKINIIVRTCPVSARSCQWAPWTVTWSDYLSFSYVEIIQTYYKNNDSYMFNISVIANGTEINEKTRGIDDDFRLISNTVIEGSFTEIIGKEVDFTLGNVCEDGSIWILGGCPYGSQRKTTLVWLSVMWLLISLCASFALIVASGTTLKCIGGGLITFNIAYLIAMAIIPRCTKMTPFMSVFVYLLPAIAPIGGGVALGIGKGISSLFE